jgi:pimeloyl-ACP methyl ester carboxylesterase
MITKMRNTWIQMLSACLLMMAAVAPSASDRVYGAEMQTEQKCVVLLHGMGRTRFSMSHLADALAARGYHVVNYGYPSTSAPIEELASEHLPQAIEMCPGTGPRPVNFVTHSLGGILVRFYLQDHSLPAGSRMVMLSPPNKGTELADRFKDLALYRWITGPPGQQLGTSESSLPNKLRPVDVDIGIITGRKTYEPWFSNLLPGEDDGKVSVESAKLDEMTDFLVVDSGHTFIMNDPEVIRQIDAFLRYGRFEREDTNME